MGNSSAAKRQAASTPLTSPIRLVIVAADHLFGEALGVLLGREAGIQVAGAAATGMEAIAAVGDTKPDVVLLDPRLPEMDYLDVIRLITRQAPSTKVLLLTAHTDSAEICGALKVGASGYVAKEAGLAGVTEAIRGIHARGMWVGGPDTPAEGGPTAREREILRLLATGGTNRDIAEALFISEKTVKTHLHHIFRKLNVTRRLQAVIHAVHLGALWP
jgi:DNA-binding NarL/FixJ family response regulator